MGGWEALRRVLSHIYGREVRDDDAALIKVYPKGSAPTTGDVIFPVYAFTPQSCPPGYEYYTDTNGNIAVKCLHSTAGATTVTEASAANIATYCQSAAAGSNYAGINTEPPLFGAHASTSTALNTVWARRIGQLLLTTDGAGACAATTAVAALAGYTGHIEILGSWSGDSGATTPTITIGVTAGTPLGITVIGFTSATNTPVTLGFGSCGLFCRGTVAADDNKAMTISMAGGGATKNYYITYKYWYET